MCADSAHSRARRSKKATSASPVKAYVHKPEFKQSAVEGLVDFFDKDNSGDIELIEFMNAFRIANRLFLLEETHGHAMLSWDVNKEVGAEDPVEHLQALGIECEIGVKASESGCFSAIVSQGFPLTIVGCVYLFSCTTVDAVAVGCRLTLSALGHGDSGDELSLGESMGVKSALSYTSDMGMTYNSSAYPHNNGWVSIPIAREEVDDFVLFMLCDTTRSEKRRKRFNMVRFEAKIDLLRRIYVMHKKFLKHRASSSSADGDESLHDVEADGALERTQPQTHTPGEDGEAEEAETGFTMSFYEEEQVLLALMGNPPVKEMVHHATALRRLDAFLRKTRCMSLKESLHCMKRPLKDEFNQEMSFDAIHTFVDDLYSAPKRIVALTRHEEEKRNARAKLQSEQKRRVDQLRRMETELETSGKSRTVPTRRCHRA